MQRLDCLPGALKVRRRAPALYQKLLKGLYNPVQPKSTYIDSQIPMTSKSGASGDVAGSEAFPLSLSVLPKRQRKRFFLPGKENAYILTSDRSHGVLVK